MILCVQSQVNNFQYNVGQLVSVNKFIQARTIVWSFIVAHSQGFVSIIAITQLGLLSSFLRFSLSSPTRLVSRLLRRIVSLTSLSNRISRRVLSRLTRCNPIHSLPFQSRDFSLFLPFSFSSFFAVDSLGTAACFYASRDAFLLQA